MTAGHPPQIDGMTDLHRIGAGGQGTVWRATESRLDRDVAIKTLDARQLGSLDVEMFERESRAIGRLSGHPNIVAVYEVDLTADVPWIKLELCRDPPPMPMKLSDAVEAAIHVSSALATAHHVGVVHGDVKPSNILWSRFGNEPKVADFGIARLMDVTDLAHVMGSSATYAPPEALTDDADERTDIYSLGSTLLYWLTGQRPSATDVMTGFDSRVIEVIARARAEQRSRYATMMEFAADLQDLQRESGDPVTALRVPPSAAVDDDATVVVQRLTPTAVDTIRRTERGRPPTETVDGRPRSSRRVPVGAGIGAVLLVLLVGGALLVPRSGGEPRSPDVSSTSAGEVDGSPVAADSPSVTASPDPALDLPDAVPTGSVVFGSDRLGETSIWVLDLATGEEQLLVDRGSDPSVARDGTVAYVCDDRVCLRQTNGETVTLSPAGSSSSEVAISPDGSQVAWVDDTTGVAGLVVARADGSTAPSPIAPSSSTDRDPSWSDDGSQLVFSSDRTGNGDIYAFDISSSSVRRLTEGPEVDSAPTLSDGTLFFVRSFGTNRELVALDGAAQFQRLTTNDAIDRDPSVTTDGGHLVFVSDRGGFVGLYQLDLETLEVELVTANEASDSDPAVTGFSFEEAADATG